MGTLHLTTDFVLISHPKQSTLAVLAACANVFILFGALVIVFLPKFVA
jgi:hypothetical protein